MTYADIKNINTRVRKYISHGRMRDAFRLLVNTTEASMLWEIGDEVKRIERNYAYMLKYLTDGATDPGRDTMYSDMVNDTYALLDKLTYLLLKKSHSTLYYDSVRYFDHSPQRLEDMLSQRSDMLGYSPAKAIEQKEADIFRRIWTLMPMNRSQADTLVFTVLDPSTSHRFRTLVLNGLILGLMEFFDEIRLDALMEIYQTGQTAITEEPAERYQAMETTSMAMAGILLALYKYRDRPMPRAIMERLKTLEDSTRWRTDLKIAFTEIIRTRDTERINRTMREEIIPGMMKMQPEIEKGIRSGILDPENLEANPEWEDMLKKSGVADRIREISELQQEGADVFMSTFTHLKNFPFFNDISNWFIPFDATRTEVAEANVNPEIVDFVENMSFLVAGDKYSFVLSLGMLSEQQKNLALTQFEMHGNQMLEQMKHDLETGTPDHLRMRTIRTYMGTLYRFYALYRRKGEFYNPFTDGINLLRVPALAEYIDDAELLRVIAEFFFQKHYWEDAADAFTRLDSVSGPDGPMYQKLGYALRSTGNMEKALEYFLQADILTPDSPWLTQMIASTYRDLNDLVNAARYYQKLTEMEPDSASYALQYGYVLLRQNLLEQALKQFYKAEFLEQNSVRAVRPLAWTLFLSGRYDESEKYYERIKQMEPTATDWLNIGHLAMARQNYADAVVAYGQSLRLRDNDMEGLLAEMREDMDTLHAMGVQSNVIQMVMDALMYTRDKVK